MGLFDKGFKGLNDENPNIKIQEELNKARKRSRRDIEETADKVNSGLGKFVKKMNNFEDTMDNARDSLEHGWVRKLFKNIVGSARLSKGDHLYVQRIGYTHHGIYVGQGKVIHYLQECVKLTDLANFSLGETVYVKTEDESPISYSASEVVSRAYSRIDEDNYNLLINNCENFAKWCRNGASEDLYDDLDDDYDDDDWDDDDYDDIDDDDNWDDDDNHTSDKRAGNFLLGGLVLGGILGRKRP